MTQEQIKNVQNKQIYFNQMRLQCMIIINCKQVGTYNDSNNSEGLANENRSNFELPTLG